MTPEEKLCNHVGPGGYKCICCGPKPKHRKLWRRTIRRRLKQLFKKRNERILEEMKNGDI